MSLAVKNRFVARCISRRLATTLSLRFAAAGTQAANKATEKARKPGYIKHGTGKLPFVGSQLGDRDDLDFWSNIDPQLKGSEKLEGMTYRSLYPPNHPTDVRVGRFLFSFLIFWTVYQSYHGLGHVLGLHDVYPMLHEMTDAELGIPPDDAEDPEYWGWSYHAERGIGPKPL